MLGTISERKRDAIARAAVTLFASDGYERTSVDAIAAEAGVSKRTVYSHFGDKESLFLSVVRETYEGMLARIGEIVDRVQWDRDLARRADLVRHGDHPFHCPGTLTGRPWPGC